MVEPAAVLAWKGDVALGALGLTAIEQHVAALIDGERPVARIAKKAGLSPDDLKVAISMLADRQLLIVKGHLQPDAMALLEPDDLDETGEVVLPPAPRAPQDVPLDLPLDALTPLARMPAAPSPFDFAAPAAATGAGGSVVTGDDGETAFPGVAIRPALNVRPATRATMAKAAVAAAPASTGTAKDGTAKDATATTATAKGPPVPQKAKAPADAAAKLKVQQMLELALKDLREGKKARALTYVRMAADLDPSDLKARSLLDNWNQAEQIAKSDSEDQRLVADAQRCEDLGQFDLAANMYRKVIALKPSEPEPYNRLGIVLALRLKDYTGAINALMKAAELAPDNVAYRSNLGKIYKLSEGKADNVSFHAGSDSDALKDRAKASKGSVCFFDRLRGKK